jgi:hypothetical protein
MLKLLSSRRETAAYLTAKEGHLPDWLKQLRDAGVSQDV